MNEYNEIVEKEERPFIKILKWVLYGLLFIALIILTFWLIKGCDNKNNPLLNQIFNDNIEKMKDAATSYYTLERLPAKEGEKVTLTLDEMIELKLLLPLIDKNNNKCSITKSYVEITKYSTEYEMKIFLSCGNEEDYIIVYMGCYDYCKNFICERKETIEGMPKCTLQATGTLGKNNTYLSNVVVKFKTKEAGTGATLTNSGVGLQLTYDNSSYTVTKDGTTTVYGYVKDSKGQLGICSIVIKKSTQSNTKKQYLYRKSVAAQYSEWSDWSADKEYTEASNIVWGQQELIWNEKNSSKKITTTTTKVETDYDQPIWQDNNDLLLTTYKQYVCDSYKYFRTGTITYQYSDWKLSNTVYNATTIPKSTLTTKYLYKGMNYELCSDSCFSKPVFIMEVWTRNATAETRTKGELEAVCNVKEVEVPVYGSNPKIVGYVTREIKTDVVTYKYLYHTKTRTIVKKAYTDEIWSYSSNDKTLINKGYKYTGISK